MPTPFYSNDDVVVELVKSNESFHSLADIPQLNTQVLKDGKVEQYLFKISLQAEHSLNGANCSVGATKVIDGINYELSKVGAILDTVSPGQAPHQRLLEALNDLIKVTAMTGSINAAQQEQMCIIRVRPDLYVHLYRNELPEVKGNNFAKGRAKLDGVPGYLYLDADFPINGRLGKNPVIPAEIIQRFNKCWPNKAITLTDVVFD